MVFSVERASSIGPAAIEEGRRGGGGQQASCLVAKQAVEFPQVLASAHYYAHTDILVCKCCRVAEWLHLII